MREEQYIIGISPVVGVILLIAITVILSGVVLVTVGQMGGQLSDSSTSTGAVTVEGNSETIHVSVIGSNSFESIYVKTNGSVIHEFDGGTVGSWANIQGVTTEDSIVIVGEDDGTQKMLFTYTPSTDYSSPSGDPIVVDSSDALLIAEVHTTDTDFANGTLSSLTIEGTNEAASLTPPLIQKVADTSEYGTHTGGAVDERRDIFYIYGSSATYIYDVSDPANPSKYGYTADINQVGTFNGSYLYGIESGSPDTFQIVDVSDPANPATVGNATPGSSGTLSSVAVNPSTEYAYTYDKNDETFYVIDVSDKTNPTVVGNVSGGPTYERQMEAISQNYVLFADADGKVHTVDVSDPTNPSFVATTSVDTARKIEYDSSSQIAYVAGNYKVHSVDASNPTNLQTLDSWGPGSFHKFKGLGYDYGNDRITIAAKNGGTDIHYVDASDPSNLAELGTHHESLDPASLGIGASGQHVHVASNRDDKFISVKGPSYPSNGTYTSANFTVDKKRAGYVDLNVTDGSADVTWEYYDANTSSWQTITTATYTTGGNYTDEFDRQYSEPVRVRITLTDSGPGDVSVAEDGVKAPE